MQDRIEGLRQEFEAALASARTRDELEALRVRYLGRRGQINDLLKNLAALPLEERRIVGARLNELKETLAGEIGRRQENFAPVRSTRDVLLPGNRGYVGHYHLLTQTLEEITGFFKGYGFTVTTGPEIEYDWYNFTALNIPKDHPARDMFSSFYIQEELLLRSHTSPVQIRTMEKVKPPIKIVCPGKVYRFDPFDASHSPAFFQFEALYVDKGVSFGELKWLLARFVKAIFGPDARYELRPSFFPFTEPSAELVVSCSVCHGAGCPVCGGSGWLELIGCGMVHPQVLRNVKISPEKYSGYALGAGVERVAMIKYMIDDIRVFYGNDVRFLEQF